MDNPLKSQLDQYREEYHNGVSTIPDGVYDALVDRYESVSKTQYDAVGAVPHGTKVDLPYYMGSLSKIKGVTAEKKLSSWCEKYPGSYIVSDKVDGNSGLYIVTHTKNTTTRTLYTRGDGEEGTDVSHLLKYLDMPIPKVDVVVRGEIVLPIQSFEEYAAKEKAAGTKKKLNNARNVGSGLVNADKSLNTELASKLTYKAFSLIELDGKPFVKSYIEQFKMLKEFDFDIPWYMSAESLAPSTLTDTLETRRKEAEYEIDGLVIAPSGEFEHTNDKKPKHMLAFKLDTFEDTVVTHVTWKVTSLGELFPKVHFEKVFLSGGELTKASGKNAKFIVENKVGPGSRIIVTRANDCIPDILEITPADTLQLPEMPEHMYAWDETHTKFILLYPEGNDEVKIQHLVYFVEHMKIKNVGEGRIKSMFNGGINTLNKLLNATVNEISKCDRLGVASAKTIRNNIDAAITNADLSTIMAASQIFGRGFGTTRMKDIVRAHPDILNYSNCDKGVVNGMLVLLGGFDKMALIFEERLPKFVVWLKEHSAITLSKSDVGVSELNGNKVASSLADKTIVLTGFRDDVLIKTLESLGAKVTGSVSKKTSILVVKDLSDMKGKRKDAEELKKKGSNIEIVSLAEFCKQYGVTSNKL